MGNQREEGSLSRRWLFVGGGAVAALAVAGLALHQAGGPGPEQTQKSASAAQVATQTEARRITPQELMPLLKKGEAVLIDVRSAEAFAASHAEGATHIPYHAIEARLKELPKEKLIALYCT
jgi:3-mercaptopyruvate sulfurtransferase SseA